MKINIKIKNIRWKSNYKVTNSFVHRREQRVLTCYMLERLKNRSGINLLVSPF